MKMADSVAKRKDCISAWNIVVMTETTAGTTKLRKITLYTSSTMMKPLIIAPKRRKESDSGTARSVMMLMGLPR